MVAMTYHMLDACILLPTMAYLPSMVEFMVY